MAASSIRFPVPANATNALIVSGSASSEGGLTRSADGRLLLLAGYNIALTNSLASLASSAATNVPRVLGALDLAGAFSLVGVTTNQYNKNNIRSGTSDGRGNYWGAGANSGTFYFGDGAPATVQTNVANTRVIQHLWRQPLFQHAARTRPASGESAARPPARTALPHWSWHAAPTAAHLALPLTPISPSPTSPTTRWPAKAACNVGTSRTGVGP